MARAGQPDHALRLPLGGSTRTRRAYGEVMITVEHDVDHVEITVSAPFTVADLTGAGATLRALPEPPGLVRVLAVVTSIGLAEPRALWEDLKLAPLVGRVRWVALVTDLAWYARLSELSGALLPHLTIKHFATTELAAARAWLLAQPPG